MSDYTVNLPSSNEVVDLAALDVRGIKQLQYREERFIAAVTISSQPFSEERQALLTKGYAFVELCIQCRAEKEGWSRLANGTSDRTIDLLARLIAKRLLEQDRLVLYEAGVGLGYTMKSISKDERVDYYGCDIIIGDDVIALNSKTNVNIEVMNVIDHLGGMADGSIDLFYADSVFEHLVPDELDVFMGMLRTKLKEDGSLLLITPPRSVGPWDISGAFLPLGARAEGLHLNERSFRENLDFFRRSGFRNVCSMFATRGKVRYVSDRWGLLSKTKVACEPLVAALPVSRSKKRRLIDMLGCWYFVLSKSDGS